MSEPATEAKVCKRCGAFGDLPHGWVEDDCILPHRTTNEHHMPRAKHGHICDHCVTRHREWLEEIVTLYATLTDVLLAGSIPDDTAEHQRVKKAPASPSPLRLDAWALLHPRMLNWGARVDGELRVGYLGGSLPDIPTLLSSWAQAAYDAQGWTATAPDTVSGAVAALTTAAELAGHQTWIDDYDAELTWIRRSLRNAHGISNPTHLGMCLNVGCTGKVWPKPGDNPRCGKCGRRYGTNDLVRLKLNEKRNADESRTA